MAKIKCLNKKIIDLLTEGVVFDYSYMSHRINDINICYSCKGYKSHCKKYIPDGIAERLRMFMEGVIDLDEPKQPNINSSYH
jgi:hypothetical protein